VQGFVDSFNRRDLDALTADLHPEVELHEWPEAPGAQTFRGPAGAREAVEGWFEAWESMHIEIQDVEEADDRILVTLHQRAKGRGSAVEVEIITYNVFTFNGGKVIGIKLLLDREEALAAAGLATDARSNR
jgi:hypothetical protein